MYEQAECLLFLLCRFRHGQILHDNAFSGFLTVIVLSCKTRQFQICKNAVQKRYESRGVIHRSGQDFKVKEGVCR